VLFGVVFGGAIVVTFNTRILGGKISLFQSVSILGYCIFPLFFAMVVLKILSLVGYNHILIKIFAMLIGALWGVLGKSFLT
jgi:protein YIPF6